MPLISVQNISMSYDGLTVLKNLSFSVYKGDYLSILGENGSGKSTLMKGLLGLKPINSGTIKFDSEISKKNIGYLPQQNTIQRDFPASVSEVVLSGCLNEKKFINFYTKRDKQLAEEKMKRLAVFDLRNKSFNELSGGQKQRVLLARALCAADKILVLDEPVSGLDPAACIEFYNTIKSLNDEENMTILMASHDLKNSLTYANKILHLNEKEMFFGTTEEYKSSDIYKNFIK